MATLGDSIQNVVIRHLELLDTKPEIATKPPKEPELRLRQINCIGPDFTRKWNELET